MLSIYGFTTRSGYGGQLFNRLKLIRRAIEAEEKGKERGRARLKSMWESQRSVVVVENACGLLWRGSSGREFLGKISMYGWWPESGDGPTMWGFPQSRDKEVNWGRWKRSGRRPKEASATASTVPDLNPFLLVSSA